MLSLSFNHRVSILLAFILIAFSPSAASAQTPEFTYQGKLSESGIPADSFFDLEFRLFDVVTGGTAFAILQRLNVPVANGVFTVQLDFGAEVFRSSPRFLEIAVKSAGSSDPFTTLAPRQPVTSAPFAIHSLSADTSDIASFASTATNANQLGGVAANQYVITTDTRLSDARNPLPDSGNYIQNRTTQQPVSNFNISGNGAANLFNAATFYNIGGNRVLSVAGSSNIFAGVNAGAVNTGVSNSFFGAASGQSNLTGGNNSFFGRSAGAFNTTSNSNSFFGAFAGQANTGNRNSFFGEGSGASNTTGFENSFFGEASGATNTTGNFNAFFGRRAGFTNSTGGNNAFFGNEAGNANVSGAANSFFGYRAGFSNTAGGNSFFGNFAGASNTTASENSFFGNNAGLSNTTGIGNSSFGSFAGSSNSVGTDNSFFGRDAGRINTANFNSFFGSQAGASNTNGDDNSFFGSGAGLINSTGSNNVFIGRSAGYFNTAGSNNTAIGANAFIGGDFFEPNVTFATAIGAGAHAATSSTIVLGRNTGEDLVRVHGLFILGTFGSSGSIAVCRGPANVLSNCSSSLRYKTEIVPFHAGLNLVNRLRPITFTWKDGGMKDVGLGAEDVEKVEPLLVTYNPQGQVEGVKYDRVAVVLLNAVREQQSQIQQQQKQLQSQQTLIDRLRKLVCQDNPQADVCRLTR